MAADDVTFRSKSWRAIVVEANPNHYAEQIKVVEYEFSNGKQFTANPALRGVYAEDD